MRFKQDVPVGHHALFFAVKHMQVCSDHTDDQMMPLAQSGLTLVA
jgi:hypothetical protein